ncbi:MAG: LD-carboxypeptidase [Pseudomonadota bacterium]
MANRMIRAKALQSQDPIAVIAPSSPFERARLRDAIGWLEKRGYQVRTDPGIYAKKDYLAGDDARRLKEFVSAWLDAGNRAVLAARGGYGSIRILEGISKKTLRGGRKILMGLSDLTLLLNHVARTTGLVTVHGPVLAGDSFLSLDETRRSRLFELLENSRPVRLREPIDFRVLEPGTAHGKLWGGNLSMVQASLGTPYEIPFSDGILFLEEVNEPRYRVDRMFAHLYHRGAFRKIRGLLLGHFLDEEGVTHDPAFLRALIERYVKSAHVPVLMGIRAGHGRNDVLLPIGGVCSIRQKGRLLELSPLVA